MGKSVKKKQTSKSKHVRGNMTDQEVENKKSELGTDKLSRVFYGWMKKRKTVSAEPLDVKTSEFDIGALICEGTFGKVLLAVNKTTNLTAAAKVEKTNSRCPQLQTEFQIYEILGSNKPGFLKVYHYGPCKKGLYNVLVMELLGPDLDDLFSSCDGIFTRKTVLMIAIQTLQLIRHVHSFDIIYRDIKPENFCIGHKFQNKEKIIYIVDFGLSKIIETPEYVGKGKQIVYDYLIGTARYMSINAHFGYDQSQRDDLEALGYMYAYFLKGRLPWTGLSKCNRVLDQYKGIANKKASTKPEEYIGKYQEFVQYFHYVKNLQYMESPNYDYLISLMTNAMDKWNYRNDLDFDWTPIMNEKYLNKALMIDPDD